MGCIHSCDEGECRNIFFSDIAPKIFKHNSEKAPCLGESTLSRRNGFVFSPRWGENLLHGHSPLDSLLTWRSGGEGVSEKK